MPSTQQATYQKQNEVQQCDPEAVLTMEESVVMS